MLNAFNERRTRISRCQINSHSFRFFCLFLFSLFNFILWLCRSSFALAYKMLCIYIIHVIFCRQRVCFKSIYSVLFCTSTFFLFFSSSFEKVTCTVVQLNEWGIFWSFKMESFAFCRFAVRSLSLFIFLCVQTINRQQKKGDSHRHFSLWSWNVAAQRFATFLAFISTSFELNENDTYADIGFANGIYQHG